jgi:hypothetical protein
VAFKWEEGIREERGQREHRGVQCTENRAVLEMKAPAI